MAGDLRGVTPRSATLTINPENWYFAKNGWPGPCSGTIQAVKRPPAA